MTACPIRCCSVVDDEAEIRDLLSTASDTVDRILGLEMGADDYLPKPLELRELLARVRGLLRRLHPAACGMAPQRVVFGRCRLDLDEHKLHGADGNVGYVFVPGRAT